ncbi:uncharacterized protein LOC120338914 [Styela clava]
MVFTVTEDVNRSEQSSFSRGKSRGRKGKGTLSALSQKSKNQSPQNSKTSEVDTEVHKELPQNEMGNVLSSQKSTNGPLLNTESEKQNNELAALLPQLDNKSVNVVTHNPTKDEKMQVDSELKNSGGIDGSKTVSDVSTDGSLNAEIGRLKQLLLLQVSLISRQQDLLRLRDREIMQLKASNSNYKCQLTRVRRRMSKRKGESPEDSPRSPKSSAKRKSSDLTTGDNSYSSVEPQQTLTNSMNDEIPDLSKTVTPTSTVVLKTKKRRHTASGELPPVKNVQKSDTTLTSEIGHEHIGANLELKSDLLSTPNDKTSIPVPLSFVEQKQAELMEAMMISPPEKAIKTFCDITKSSPQLDEFPFKICNRCPHCVAIATEITRLFKTAENSSSPQLQSQIKTIKPMDRDILRLAAIDNPSLEIKNPTNKDLSKCTEIMRTGVSYFRFSPTFDLNHWWWDLKCGSIKVDSSLKIPTWKEEEFSPLIGTSDQVNLECTDDATFIKRHMKHEQDEKKRKRWDIQRIREYRYNEKLRQKLMKQGAVYEAPVIETFSGHLHDAESVEVHESLPVNVFGYPTPHIEPEEFSLAPMYDSLKCLASGGPGRRKQKKV